MDWFTIRTMSHGALSYVPFIYFPFIVSKSTSFWCLLAIFCCQAKRKEVNFESFLFKSEESTSHGHVRGDSKSPFFPSNLKLCHSNPTFNPESSVTQDLWCSLIHSYLVCIAAWPMLRFMIKKLLNTLILLLSIQSFVWQKTFTSSLYFRTGVSQGCGK